MAYSIAQVATENGGNYLRRLCKHWAHRFEVDFNPDDLSRGFIDFGSGQSVLLESTDQQLKLTVTDEQSGDLEQLERVVEEHLQRSANKESLVFNWVRQEG